MQTDHEPKAPEPREPIEPKASALRRTGNIALSLINPFSDLAVIYRKGILPTRDRLRVLRQMATPGRVQRESLSYAQAVERAGMPAAQLQKGFKRLRAVWWILMFGPGTLSLGLMLMVLISSALPSGTLLRAGLTILVLATLSLVGFGNALIATYRLWQLKEKRVSEEEGGTFRDFLAENRWCRQVLTLGMFV